MISGFFIDRPIFAWVIALFIVVLGGAAISKLPVAQYPTVAPPSLVVSVGYPGASAQVLEDSVLSVIEQELNGTAGMIYVESIAQANGSGSITATFETGTNVDLAQVELQNRLSRATPRLPSAVVQQGVRIDKARSNFLLFVSLTSSNPADDPIVLGDYIARYIQPELQRVPGVGQAQLFGTERAMRIWLDPAKLVSFGLAPSDFNLRKTTIDLVSEQAAAFYDPRKRRLSIIETSGQSGMEKRAALIHELAHAIADQHFHLERYIKKGSKNDDAETARQAVVEGQATWLMWAYVNREGGGEAGVGASAMAAMDQLAETNSAQYPALAEAPLSNA